MAAKNSTLPYGKAPKVSAFAMEPGESASASGTPRASQLLALTPEQDEYQRRLKAAGLLLDSQGALL